MSIGSLLYKHNIDKILDLYSIQCVLIILNGVFPLPVKQLKEMLLTLYTVFILICVFAEFVGSVKVCCSQQMLSLDDCTFRLFCQRLSVKQPHLRQALCRLFTFKKRNEEE